MHNVILDFTNWYYGTQIVIFWVIPVLLWQSLHNHFATNKEKDNA